MDDSLGWCKYGAGERIRTVDSYLGKVALYQLSYARNLCFGKRA